MDKFTKIAVVTGIAALLSGAPLLFFLVTDNQAGVVATLALVAVLLGAATHAAAFAAGAWYTRGSMMMGAEVALRAQETNDRWDERKTEAMGRIYREGASAGRRFGGGGDDVGALPLPSQGMGEWVPQLAAYRIED